MSNDEKNGYGFLLFLSLFTTVPMALAFLFICCRASAKEVWHYYAAFFLIGIAPRLIRIALKLLFCLESGLHGGTGTGVSLGPLFYGVVFYFPVELIFFGALSSYLEELPGYHFHFGWNAVLFLFLIVLVQAGMHMYQDAMDVPHHFKRLHRAVYNRKGWFPYSYNAIASTYSMPRGRKYQEVGIVLIERRKKENYKTEEDYLSGRGGFLFMPLFLIRSSTTIQPPDILYKPEHKGLLGLRFMGDGTALIKHYEANRSFNRYVYFFRLRKFLQVPSGYRKSPLPCLTFSGLCPVLVPKKNHSSPRLFLVVCMALLCAVWTTGCAATIFTGALLVDRINLATLKTSLDGTVVDETGVPMKDVKLVARFSYPTWDYTSSKTKTERHIIDGKFDIWKLGYCDVDL